MNKLYFGDSFDPYRNLAAEEMMFDAAHGGCMTLYLWQNANTVVIGRNQNAWRECRAALLTDEGGRLARRTTGGGAVYHDLGNLNFSFVCAREEYDLARQTSVILAAVSSLGVKAAFTGRNDLVAEGGAKFSGNAFRFTKTSALQHGTLLVSADMDKLSRYLAPSKEKLRAKGVESVRARVCNLSGFGAHITVPSLTAAITKAFTDEYGAAQTLNVASLGEDALNALYSRNASWEWNMGASPVFDISLETRFEWGSFELFLNVSHGTISSARVFSDAMDEAFIALAAPALEGCRLDGKALAQRIVALGQEQTKNTNAKNTGEYSIKCDMAQSIAAWLSEKEF